MQLLIILKLEKSIIGAEAVVIKNISENMDAVGVYVKLNKQQHFDNLLD